MFAQRHRQNSLTAILTKSPAVAVAVVVEADVAAQLAKRNLKPTKVAAAAMVAVVAVAQRAKPNQRQTKVAAVVMARRPAKTAPAGMGPAVALTDPRLSSPAPFNFGRNFWV